MKITVLGTGTSGGVPVIGCNCQVCHSQNPKDNRLRSSLLIEHSDVNVVIDAGPDFRQQMLKYEVKSLSHILITHAHKDHTGGLDDIRPYNYLKEQRTNIYADAIATSMIKSQYDYIFSNPDYPGVPQVRMHEINDEAIVIEGLTFIPINVLHYKLPVKAFRIRNFAYITDANYIAEEEKQKLKNLDILILNALHQEPHISHFSLHEAIQLSQELNPKKTYLTHISHKMGLYNEIEPSLPNNISLAYDGLELEV